MNKQYIIRNIWRTASTAMLLLLATVLGSCSNEPDAGIPYFRLENVLPQSKIHVTNATELGFDVVSLVGNPALELIRYDIRSNRDWVAECNSADASWLKIHPTEGSGDGIIRFCVYDNDEITPRSTTVVFRYSDGTQTQMTLAVNQKSNAPYLEVNAIVNGEPAKAIEVERAAASYTINVGSNVDYFYSATKADWFTFTETEKRGVFELEIEAYPEDATELERNALITFKGVGDHASLVAELPIHQSIVPYIKVESKELKKDAFSPFEATVLTPITFTIRSNYDWEIEQPVTDSWYIISQMAGEADKDYTVTITPLSTNTDEERTSEFAITASTFTRKLTVTQEGGGSKPKPVEGFPVTWSFPADGIERGMVNVEERWYKSDDERATISIVQPERYPTTPNMSYTIGADGELGRILSFGFCLDNYWLFEIPEVKNLRTTTRIQLNTILSSSAAGPKFFMLEYSIDDKETWTAVNTKSVTLASTGRTVLHTVMLPYVSVANEDQVIKETFSISKNMANGTLYLRLRVCDTRSNKDDKEIIAKNGGTTRMKTRAGSCEQFSVKIIE